MTPEPAHLHAESHGFENDPTVLLIAPLSHQLISWPMGFVHAIVVGGFCVVRFDNRDVGLSDRTPGGKVNLSNVVRGDPSTAPYTLDTMADDTVALLDRLGIARAHVVGRSMGGGIAQSMAARHPERVLTLTSMMSTTGAAGVGGATRTGAGALQANVPADPERAIAVLVGIRRAMATPGAFDETADPGRIRYMYRRGYDPAGVGRQFAALAASGDRTSCLRHITARTLVLHGADDPIVDPSGGRATAEAIPGARYVEISGVAHDLPEDAWPEILQPMFELWRTDVAC